MSVKLRKRGIIMPIHLNRRFALFLIPIFLLVLLFNANNVFSQATVINCKVTILPAIGAVKLRSSLQTDDNSWMLIITANSDGSMVVTTAKTYDPGIWPEGTVITLITATEVIPDKATGLTWVRVTLIDDKGHTFPLKAYLVYRNKDGGYFLKLTCAAAGTPATASAPTVAVATAVPPTAIPPTAVPPTTVALPTITL